MNDRALRVLEYNKIIKMLRDRTVSSLGRSYVEKLKPDSDFFEVEASLKETTHALAYLWRRAGSLWRIHDVRAAVKRVDIGSVLSISELLRIGDVLRCSRNIKQFLTMIYLQSGKIILL